MTGNRTTAILAPMVVQRLDSEGQLIDYREAWDLQRRIHAEVAAGERPDTLLLLQHAEIFTAGSRTQPQDRPVDGSEVIDVDRGGRITWHGPGQLVGYPITRLPHPLDVVAYVRAMEQQLIALCGTFGVGARQVAGRSGVWVGDDAHPAKIAAIGVRVTRGTTMHGFAVNCDCDLSWSERIVPCGITDAGVTSLTMAAGRRIGVQEAADALCGQLESAWQ